MSSLSFACYSPSLLPARLISTTRTCMSSRPGRPTLEDVERISRGLRARRRGVGSRAVPHRLNLEERRSYDSAKDKGFLETTGEGYRRTRKGTPLPNIYRQYCDAMAVPFVHLVKSMTGQKDEVRIDMSTLRRVEVDCEMFEMWIEMGEEMDAVDIERKEESWKLLSEDDVLGLPIWELPSLLVTAHFEERSKAKAFAKTTQTSYRQFCIEGP